MPTQSKQALLTQAPLTHEQRTSWFVYMILDTDQHLYTGITTNMARRWREHTSGKAGARYFRGRQPAFLCLLEEQPDRSCASKREYLIKCMQRRDKLTLIHQTAIDTLATISRFNWTALPCLADESPLRNTL